MSVLSGPLKNGYFHALLAVNGLNPLFGGEHILFFEGMRFGSRKTWWGSGKPRPQSHEGLDLCFYRDESGHPCRLDETIRVPAAFDSRVVALISDFLGTTVVAAHGRADSWQGTLVFYAHIVPDETVQTGRHLAAGQTFAHIAPPGRKRLLPPHLHLSMALADRLPPAADLDWPQLNRVERKRFLDPAEMLAIDGRIIEFVPGTDLYKAFFPVSRRPF